MAHDKSAEDNMNERTVASRGKDQRQGKQHATFMEGSVNIPAASGRFQGSSGRSREDEDLVSISSQTDQSESDLEKLQHEELSGSDNEAIESANYSDTDEDENEGLGDGKLGRSARGGLDR